MLFPVLLPIKFNRSVARLLDGHKVLIPVTSNVYGRLKSLESSRNLIQSNLSQRCEIEPIRCQICDPWLDVLTVIKSLSN